MKSEEDLFSEALERGIGLFNEGRYGEAYEVWETRWSEDMTEGTELLQGLLQISVGLAKLEGGNPRGTLKLLDRGMDLLKPYGPEAYDIDIDALLEVVSAFRERAAALIAEGNEGGNTVVSTERQNRGFKEETPRAPWWKRLLR
jgi:predicted metal-dependent hydrolase